MSYSYFVFNLPDTNDGLFDDPNTPPADARSVESEAREVPESNNVIDAFDPVMEEGQFGGALLRFVKVYLDCR